MHYCRVPGCYSKQDHTKMHVLPNDDRFKIWATFIGRADLEISKRKSYCICDKHFSEEMKYPICHNKTNLKKSALPTIISAGNFQNAVPVEEEDRRSADHCNTESINLISDISDNIQQNVIQEDIIQQSIKLISDTSDNTQQNVIQEDIIQQSINLISDISDNTQQNVIQEAIIQQSINLISDISDYTQQNVLQDEIIQQISECTITKNLSNTCITCLKDDVQMETLSSLSVLSEFKELFKYLRIYGKLKVSEFSNIIAINSVCSNCVLQMHNMLSFKRQCEESKEKLGLFLQIPEIVQSSADVEQVFDKATQTEIEERINSKTFEETSAEIEKELENITDVEEKLENITPSENELKVNSETEEKCVNCNEKFNNKSLLRRHQILMHGLKNCIQECHYCLQLYTIKSYKSKLKIHNEYHHENICIVCDLKFETIFHLAKHRVLHTLSSNKDCRSRFHFKNCHNIHQPCGKVACAQCGKVYSSVKTLRLHILRMHYHSIKVKQSKKVKQSSKVKIPCTICSRSVYNLNEHLKRHQTHKFQQRTSVSRKKTIQTKDELCPYCGKFYTLGSLRGHIATVHLKIKNYECDYCNKKFSTANLRTNHIKAVHLKLKRFSCDYCDEKFLSRAHVKCHMFKHTQVKTIKCRFCDKLLCGNLKRHLENVHKLVLF